MCSFEAIIIVIIIYPLGSERTIIESWNQNFCPQSQIPMSVKRHLMSAVAMLPVLILLAHFCVHAMMDLLEMAILTVLVSNHSSRITIIIIVG